MANKVNVSLDWRGEQTFAQCVTALEGTMTELNLRAEAPAKGALSPGHGVLTGTFRRSIHGASPAYGFANDNVAPSTGSPERAGTGGGALRQGMKIVSHFGSGLNYALLVEQRYGSIVAGYLTAANDLPMIMEKHGKAAGL